MAIVECWCHKIQCTLSKICLKPARESNLITLTRKFMSVRNPPQAENTNNNNQNFKYLQQTQRQCGMLMPLLIYFLRWPWYQGMRCRTVWAKIPTITPSLFPESKSGFVIVVVIFVVVLWHTIHVVNVTIAALFIPLQHCWLFSKLY